MNRGVLQTARAAELSGLFGFNVGGIMMNILAYADDIVLLAPSWTAMQTLLDVLDINIHLINVTCNTSKTSKTLCMVFNPVCCQKVVCDKFPGFLLSGQKFLFYFYSNCFLVC